MSKLAWDQVGEKTYETGTDHGVLYPIQQDNTYSKGAAWNGLTAVTDSPSGAEATDLYADNIKYLSLRSAEEFGFTIEAYESPEEFDQCDGSASPVGGVKLGQQGRKMFGFSYRSIVGNDTENNDHGYKLHLIYGATASPSERAYQTVNDSPEAITFSWECETTPVNVTGYKPTSIITIDSTTADPTKLAALEAILYGSDATTSYAEVTPEVGDNPKSEGWYERSGSEEPYTYTLTDDTSVDAQKTYYAKTTSGGSEARMPLPDEVIELMTPTNIGG